jgi:hypothetical protein
MNVRLNDDDDGGTGYALVTRYRRPRRSIHPARRQDVEDT